MIDENINLIAVDIDSCIHSESFQKMLLMYFYIGKRISDLELKNRKIYDKLRDKLFKKYSDISWMKDLEFYDRISNNDSGELLFDKHVQDNYAYHLDDKFYSDLLIIKREIVETMGLLKSDLVNIGSGLKGFDT